MRIGSRVIPLPAVGAAAAGLIAIIVIAVVVVAGGGGDDDDGGGETASASRTASANRTSVSQSRTRIPLTSTAIAGARQTAIAEGTPEDAFDAANPTPAPPTAVPDAGTIGPGVTPGPGTVPPATPLPGETATAAPTATSIPPGEVGDITMDGNRNTPEIDHADVTAGVGATVEIAIVINDALGGYNGYEYALVWDEGDGLVFVSEQRTPPPGVDICSDPVDPFTATDDGRTGTYGGCLAAEGTSSFTGVVAVITVQCQAAGRVPVRLLAASGSEAFPTRLLAQGGEPIETEVDDGFDVVCT